MSPKIALVLDDQDRLNLERIILRGTDWRQRQRAETLLMLAKGNSTAKTADVIGIHARTVLITLKDWRARGYPSLVDAPRSGAPRKISSEQVVKIVNMASQEPLTAKTLLAKHVENGGTMVHVNTLRVALKEAGFLWKRTRHSLKKRDETAFREAEKEIAVLREKADNGEMVLAYLDEAGFSQVHPNRSAWTPKAGRHLIEAKRGKRLNVLAAMLSNGELFSAKLWQTTTSDLFIGFLGLLKEHVAKPITVILDNASIHKAKANALALKYLKTLGVTLYFLPPYSPELNRIEKLWHLMKHTWMKVKCRNSATLEADLDEILDNFGTRYQFPF